MQRFDQGHDQSASPHPARIPRERLQELISMLENREIDIAEFAGKVTQYPAIYQRIMTAANSVTVGRLVDITDPVHAAAYLGSRRLIHLLNNLSPEVVTPTTGQEAA